jgi:hypothetical protein
MFYLLIGNNFEFVWSATTSHLSWLRFNTTLFEMRGLQNLISGTKRVTFTPALGFEFELLPLSSALFQSRLGLRAGYQLSTDGHFSADSCKAESSDAPIASCSFPVFQGFFSFSFYERVQVRVGLEWTPPWFPKLPPKHTHWFSTLINVGWQWI